MADVDLTLVDGAIDALAGAVHHDVRANMTLTTLETDPDLRAAPIVVVFAPDPVPGNLGLTPTGALVFLPFSEPTGVAPSDAVGNLGDLVAPAGVTVPAVNEDAWTGRGRVFASASSTALTAADLPDGDTLVTRDVTIQALLTVTTEPALAGVIVARGLDGTAGPAGYYAYGLDVVADGDFYRVRAFYMTESGDLVVDIGALFDLSGPGTFLLTATRRWAIDAVTFRYFGNAEFLGENVSTETSIAGSTVGAMSVGARMADDAWTDFLDATIEELKIFDYEVSAEEIAATVARLTVHQPQGVAAFRALTPPGMRWGDNPGGLLGRRLKIAGQAIGYATATAESLRAQWLPATAPSEFLARWERINGIAAEPLAALAERRDTVVSFLSREHGFSRPAIRTALARPFDQEPDDVEILEFTNEIPDDFATLESERWACEPSGSWVINAGELEIYQASGSDVRWGYPDRVWARMCLPSTSRMVASVKLSEQTLIPSATIAGLVVADWAAGAAFWYGVQIVAGTRRLGWIEFVDHVASAFTILDTVADAPIYLRIVERLGDFVLTRSDDGIEWTDAETISVSDGVLAAKQVGVGVRCSAESTDAELLVSFDDFFVRAPFGDRPFHWYAYRDPLLDGAPDMGGAHLLVGKLKPAHTHAAAIAGLSLLCDDIDHTCDCGPMGGL